MAAVLNHALDTAARARLVDRFGPAVERWCDALPALVARLAARWHLTILEARAGNTGRTLLCASPEGPRVLKLCPDPAVTTAESTALHAWTGLRCVVQILDVDLGEGAILLERLLPGTTLDQAPIPWDQVRDLITEIHRVPAPATLPTQLDRIHTMFDLAERRLRGSAAQAHLPLPVLDVGRTRAAALAVSGPVPHVHGDLHPGNVLDAGADRGIVASTPARALATPRSTPSTGRTCRCRPPVALSTTALLSSRMPPAPARGASPSPRWSRWGPCVEPDLRRSPPPSCGSPGEVHRDRRESGLTRPNTAGRAGQAAQRPRRKSPRSRCGREQPTGFRRGATTGWARRR
ncbi:MAG TPA: aminoglycoside phosphotransferase family protein [Amycolatopsis sp.]|nr:aminoglycoside phosphotransferase family protein [Amycolatopsis sp.]